MTTGTHYYDGVLSIKQQENNIKALTSLPMCGQTVDYRFSFASRINFLRLSGPLSICMAALEGTQKQRDDPVH